MKTTLRIGDIVEHKSAPWSVPGVVIKKPYGALILPSGQTSTVGYETLVVDVLVGTEVFLRIRTSDLNIIF